jgi:hypothetical protein
MREPRTPWDAYATVVKLTVPPGDPQLLFEGPLAAAVDQLGSLQKWELARYRISLPNRAERPRMFQGEALVELVAARPVRDMTSF